jgi:hypothetical protein
MSQYIIILKLKTGMRCLQHFDAIFTENFCKQVIPCHHGMARPQVADGDALQFWRAAANILNKLSRTADNGMSSSLGVGRAANNSSP